MNEADERLAALVTPYGLGTRSQLRSTEAREMRKVRKAVTDSYVPQPATIGPICACRSFRYPHEVEAHKKLMSDYDWRTWQERKHSQVWRERVT